MMNRTIFLIAAVSSLLFGAACIPQTQTQTNTNQTQNVNGSAVVPTVNASVTVNAPSATNVLVQIDRLGGFCQAGTCTRQITINHDGSYQVDGKTQVTLTTARLRDLQTKIDRAAWTSIKAKPFTGQCPRSYDGSADRFTFFTTTGAVVIDSCAVAIDFGIEPFKTVLDIQSGLYTNR